VLVTAASLSGTGNEQAIMPWEHIIYIPAALLLGMTIGYTLGARAVRAEFKRLRERARR
jgi:membrane protein DedA with SNARE-associated domain